VKAVKELAVMRGLYVRSVLLLLWLMALAVAVGVFPHHA